MWRSGSGRAARPRRAPPARRAAARIRTAPTSYAAPAASGSAAWTPQKTLVFAVAPTSSTDRAAEPATRQAGCHEGGARRASRRIRSPRGIEHQEEAVPLDQRGKARDAERHDVEPGDLPGLQPGASATTVRGAEVQARA